MKLRFNFPLPGSRRLNEITFTKFQNWQMINKCLSLLSLPHFISLYDFWFSVCALVSILGSSSHTPPTSGTVLAHWQALNLLNEQPYSIIIGQNAWGLISHWQALNSFLERAWAELRKNEARFHPNTSKQIVKMLRNRDFMTFLLSLGTELAHMMGGSNSAYLPFTIT